MRRYKLIPILYLLLVLSATICFGQGRTVTYDDQANTLQLPSDVRLTVGGDYLYSTAPIRATTLAAADGVIGLTIATGTGDLAAPGALTVTGQLSSPKPGTGNEAFGGGALVSSAGDNNTATGIYALRESSGNNNTAAGGYALYQSPGGSNTATGIYALYLSPGSYNTAAGSSALRQSPGSYNTAAGRSALYLSPGSSNTAAGHFALFEAPGSNNTAVGYHALDPAAVRTINRITAIGSLAAENLTTGADNIVALGYKAGFSETNGTNKLYLGGWDSSTQYPVNHHWEVSTVNASNRIEDFWVNRVEYELPLVTTAGIMSVPEVRATTLAASDGVVGLTVATGTGALAAPGALTVSGQLSSPKAGTSNEAFGASALASSAGDYNTAAGYYALRESPGSSNTAAGNYALYLSPGSNNTAAGHYALHQSTGNSSTAAGWYALYGSPGSRNTAVGNAALRESPGSNNTAFGYRALDPASARTVNRITSVGSLAAENLTTGADNIVALGYKAGFTETNGTNKLYLGGWDGSTQYPVAHRWEVTSVNASKQVTDFVVNRVEYRLPLLDTDGDLMITSLDVAGFVDLTAIAEPASPASGKIRLYMDVLTGQLSVKGSNGTTEAITSTLP